MKNTPVRILKEPRVYERNDTFKGVYEKSAVWLINMYLRYVSCFSAKHCRLFDTVLYIISFNAS